MNRFSEAVDAGWGQYFDIEREILHRHTACQELRIFESALFGRVLVLDGVVQTTSRDEYIYHEMLIHPALLAHPDPRRVLIIGGGDGGCLREALKHPLDEAVLVELDAGVIEACRAHLPMIADGAFEDPRCRIEIGDGAAFIRESAGRFDVIVVDSSDPVGPSAPLFDTSFYAQCAVQLRPGGMVAAQHGVAFTQPEAFIQGYRALAGAMAHAAPYAAHVPSYSGGPLMITLGADAGGALAPAPGVLAARMAERGLAPRHYTPELHYAAFALPGEVKTMIGKG